MAWFPSQKRAAGSSFRPGRGPALRATSDAPGTGDSFSREFPSRALARLPPWLAAQYRVEPTPPDISPEALPDEVAGSVQELENHGLPRPRMFAYPNGAWNFLVRRAVRNAGLQAAFTVDPGLAREGVDPYQIPRIEIFRKDTGWRFLWKVICTSV